MVVTILSACKPARARNLARVMALSRLYLPAIITHPSGIAPNSTKNLIIRDVKNNWMCKISGEKTKNLTKYYGQTFSFLGDRQCLFSVNNTETIADGGRYRWAPRVSRVQGGETIAIATIY